MLFPLLTIRDIGIAGGPQATIGGGGGAGGVELVPQSDEAAAAEFKLGEEEEEEQQQQQQEEEGCEGEQVRELTLWELLRVPQSYHVSLFFLLVLTPGWGIKLAAIFMMRVLFGVSERYAEAVTVIYLSSYASGRLFSGLIAQRLGNRPTYYLFITCMCCLLCALPSLSESASIEAFVLLISLIGLLYGGCKALFYSLVFDIFGQSNYRMAFSLCQLGFCGAVIIGGISSAYSFSSGATEATGRGWFYAMVASSLAALALLAVLKPIDGVSEGGMRRKRSKSGESTSV